MDKLLFALDQIRNCDFCGGSGALYWDNGDDYNVEDCECNPYGLILDGDEVIWDNGLLSHDDLSIFATGEAL